jgi:hypothetical protein
VGVAPHSLTVTVTVTAEAQEAAKLLACSTAQVSQRKHTIGSSSDDNASKRSGSSQLLEAEHVDGVDDGFENEVECV